jgi:ribonuclease BN (tRNA processing enzyme)
MRLTVLGCGDAFGNGGRFNTSFLLTDAGEHVLVDCGASTLIRLKQESIILENISTIIISHFHADHYAGLPYILISSLFEKKRLKPLAIVGPKGIKEKVFSLQEIMYEGTGEKLADLNIQFIEFKEEEPIDVSDKLIATLPVDHSPASLPHAIRLEWKNKVFAFSGDTSWTDNLIHISNGADLFICECNFLDNQAFGHLSQKELLSKRNELKCDNIWLSHMGNEVLNDQGATFNKLSDGMVIQF